MVKGKFIVFEGIDGSGTSTHVHKLSEKLETHDKYQDILRTHEPWRSEEIKKRLEEDSEAYSGGLEMAELYVKDRAEHVRQLIRPNLETDVVVLSSRYKMSTCAYQWTQGVPLHDLIKMHEYRDLLIPDLTFFIDVPRDVAQERINISRENTEKFEKDHEFVDKLIHSYRTLVDISETDPRYFGNVINVDGNRDIEKVADEIFEKFLKVYEQD